MLGTHGLGKAMQGGGRRSFVKPKLQLRIWGLFLRFWVFWALGNCCGILSIVQGEEKCREIILNYGHLGKGNLNNFEVD